MSARPARPGKAGAPRVGQAAFGLDEDESRERNDDGRPDS